jgi:uncharacterized cupin superfamily protein
MAKVTVKRPDLEEVAALGATRWPIWTCGVSEFDWSYDERETCLLIEGTAEVSTAEGTFRFGAGDLVVFEEGLRCRWKVTAPVRKHYRFG